MMAFSLKTDFDSKTSIFNMLEIFETPHFFLGISNKNTIT